MFKMNNFINKYKKVDYKGNKYIGFNIPNNVVDNNVYKAEGSYVVMWQGYALFVKLEKENNQSETLFSLV